MVGYGGKDLRKRKVLSLERKSEGVMDDESGEYLVKLQARTWLSRALVHLANTLLKDGKNDETITFLFVTLPYVHRF